MRDYINYVRPDGLPTDSWLRTHLRVGGKFVKIAPYAMTIVGSLADWSGWTGMPFDRSGEMSVPGALVPVMVSRYAYSYLRQSRDWAGVARALGGAARFPHVLHNRRPIRWQTIRNWRRLRERPEAL